MVRSGARPLVAEPDLRRQHRRSAAQGAGGPLSSPHLRTDWSNLGIVRCFAWHHSIASVRPQPAPSLSCVALSAASGRRALSMARLQMSIALSEFVMHTATPSPPDAACTIPMLGDAVASAMQAPHYDHDHSATTLALVANCTIPSAHPAPISLRPNDRRCVPTKSHGQRLVLQGVFIMATVLRLCARQLLPSHATTCAPPRLAAAPRACPSHCSHSTCMQPDQDAGSVMRRKRSST